MDICDELRKCVGGLEAPSLCAQAADEIERLRAEVARLKKANPPDRRYEDGYARAQHDIRMALGIDS